MLSLWKRKLVHHCDWNYKMWLSRKKGIFTLSERKFIFHEEVRMVQWWERSPPGKSLWPGFDSRRHMWVQLLLLVLAPTFFPPAPLFWIFKLLNFNAPISFNLIIFFFDFSWTPLAWMRTFKESMRVSENILRGVWHPYERSLLKILKSTGQIMSELCRWGSKNFWTS